MKKTDILLKKDVILDIKGIGGFHLTCDAANHGTVTTLRERKRRSKKPFAPSLVDVFLRHDRNIFMRVDDSISIVKTHINLSPLFIKPGEQLSRIC